jgi:hypothetical protein
MGALCGKSFQDELYEELNKKEINDEKKKYLEAWIKQIYTKDMENYTREQKDNLINQLNKNF